MRLVSFSLPGAPERLLGALEGDRVLDLAAAASVVAPGLDAAGRLRSLDCLLSDWDQGLPLARSVMERAAGAGGGGGGGKHAAELAPAWHPRIRVTLHPPVSRPPAVRDFYAFEAHVKNARARRKLLAKSLDLVVGNLVGVDDSGFEVETNRAVVVHRSGQADDLGLVTKRELARHVVDAVAALLGPRVAAAPDAPGTPP